MLQILQMIGILNHFVNNQKQYIKVESIKDDSSEEIALKEIAFYVVLKIEFYFERGKLSIKEYGNKLDYRKKFSKNTQGLFFFFKALISH